MELTKEYFDQQLGLLNQQMAGMITKADIADLEAKIPSKELINKLYDVADRLVGEVKDYRQEQAVVHKRVQQLESDSQKVKEALHID